MANHKTLGFFCLNIYNGGFNPSGVFERLAYAFVVRQVAYYFKHFRLYTTLVGQTNEFAFDHRAARIYVYWQQKWSTNRTKVWDDAMMMLMNGWYKTD